MSKIPVRAHADSGAYAWEPEDLAVLWAKIPENRIWGPVEAASGKFSGDLKFAHGDSATDEPKKSGF